MKTEDSSDSNEKKSSPSQPPSSSPTEIPTMEENKLPLSPKIVDIVEVNKPTFHKKVDITFQLSQFKRFILFGTETHYKSCSRQSINRWFITETNIRLYIEEYKIKCLRCFSLAIEVLDKSDDEKDAKRKEDIISRMADILTENANHSPAGVIPYLLYRIHTCSLIRPVMCKVFLSVIRNSTELLLFAYYLKKVKGGSQAVRRALAEWYDAHSTNPDLLKDLLLVKRRFGWRHRDVIVHWKVPVAESNGILRLLMGFPYDPKQIPEEKKSLINKLVQLRTIDDRMDWMDFVNSPDYISEIGLDLYYNIKPRIYSVDVLKILIQRLPLNEYIEHIPRMWQKYPWSQELTSAMIDQLKDWKKKYDKNQRENVNILSVFIVWKWLKFQDYLFHGEGKNLRESGTIDAKYYPQLMAPLQSLVGSILEDNDYKRSEEVLFVLNIPVTDLDESGSNFQKKPANQELKRPFILSNVIKPIEFIQFLLFIYPKNRVIYKEKHYKVSGDSYEKVEEELTKVRQSTTNCLPSTPIKPYKYAIVITFDGSVDLTDEGPLKQHSVEKIVVSSIRDKDLTQVKDKLIQRNLLFIKGVDCNFFSHIEKYFHVDC